MPARQLMQKAVEGIHPDGHLETTLRTSATCFFRLIGELALAGEQLEKSLPDEPAAAPAATA